MRRVTEPRPILLSGDIVLQNGRHPFEVRDHAFDLAGPLTRGFAAELLQPIQPVG
jgi:hypothetical protein